jgi:uncharacterized cofD-like protein
LHIKRWLVLMFFGMALIALGMGYAAVELYRTTQLSNLFYWLTLQFVPRVLRAVLFGGVGLLCLLIGFTRFTSSLLKSVRASHDDQPIVEKLWQRRIGAHGPRVVAIGGGHGMAALLKGLKKKTSNITAIVTVADDGGSSGRLRRDFGLLPPGDFRMCISALADDDSLVSQLFQYRFGKTRDGDKSDLSGHSFGNLFIAAMAELTGSFERALLESSKVVASKGHIVPSTLSDVTLCAEFKESTAPMGAGVAAGSAPTQARGESSIGKVGRPIERVWLEPNDVAAFPDAARAILNADLVVMGPGSLFTSVLPNVLVAGLAEALRQTTAPCVYVCNVATERGETDGFTVDEHVAALEAHIGKGIVDVVVVNDNVDTGFKPPVGVTIVQPTVHLSHSQARVQLADVVDNATPWRHDSNKLTDVVLKLIG